MAAGVGDDTLRDALAVQVHILNGVAPICRKFGDNELVWASSSRSVPMCCQAAGRRVPL